MEYVISKRTFLINRQATNDTENNDIEEEEEDDTDDVDEEIEVSNNLIKQIM